MAINKSTKQATNPKTIPIAFDNVQDLKDYVFLEVGDKVRTLGYYSVGDGGGNDYEIVAAATGTNDGGSFIDLSGSGLQAKGLFVDDVISLQKFGAAADGVADDTPARDAMYEYWLTFDIETKPKLYAGPGKFRFTSKFTTGEEGFVLIGAGNSSPFTSFSTLRGGTQFIYDGPELTDTEGFFEFGVTQQCRGAHIEGITFLCDYLANAVWLESCSKSVFIGNTFADTKHGIVASGSNNNNLVIERNVFYRPATGYGGIDLKENAHAASVTRNAFINDPEGEESPVFAVRIAHTGNCSAVSVDDNSFDFYRVTGGHFQVSSETRGGQFTGNYIECRGDGVTDNAVTIDGGAGWMFSGNRLTASDSPTATTVNYGINLLSSAKSVSVVGNYFSGFDTACVRVSDGAANIFIAGNDRGALTLFVDQNAAGSKAVCAIDDGAITATDYITSA